MGDWEKRALEQRLRVIDEIYSNDVELEEGWNLSHLLSPINNRPGNVQNQTNVSNLSEAVPSSSNASVLKRSNSNLSEADRAKKRKIDWDYRQRRKKAQEDTQSNLKKLKGENDSLKKENHSLKEKNAEMNQTLRGQEKVIDQLRNNLAQLKRECGKQNVLVETLSGHFAHPVRLENEKLKDENALLRKNANLNYNFSLLMEENAELRTENKVLKVQNDALCGKIISDNDKKREQEKEAKISIEDTHAITM